MTTEELDFVAGLIDYQKCTIFTNLVRCIQLRVDAATDLVDAVLLVTGTVLREPDKYQLRMVQSLSGSYNLLVECKK